VQLDQQTVGGPQTALAGHSALGVEFVMDSFRVIGEIVTPGGPRRLVDIMNAIDVAYVLVRNAQVDDPLTDEDTPRPFDIVQVHLNTILFGVPHGSDVMQKDPMEAVHKVPVPSMIAMPGYEMRGNIHMLPEIEPGETPLLGTRHFVPLTNVEIRAAFNPRCIWREELVVVNLARAVLYAPRVAGRANCA
jgi:hypothetical protein